MSAGELMDVAARALGYLSILGILAALGVWALYATEHRATKRRNAIRDARRRHPAGKALAGPTGFQCPVCRNPWHYPETCDRCADILIVLDKEASS